MAQNGSEGVYGRLKTARKCLERGHDPREILIALLDVLIEEYGTRAVPVEPTPKLIEDHPFTGEEGGICTFMRVIPGSGRVQCKGRRYEHRLTRRCEAALNIRGEHFQCDLAAYPEGGGHDGLAHSSRDAQAIWGEPRAEVH